MPIKPLSISVLALALTANMLAAPVNGGELSGEENARCRAATEVVVTVYDGLLVMAMLSGDRADKEKVHNIQAARDNIANTYLPLFASAPPPSQATEDELINTVPAMDLVAEVLACGEKVRS